jgi:hypothetical protein
MNRTPFVCLASARHETTIETFYVLQLASWAALQSGDPQATSAFGVLRSARRA